LFGGAPDGAHGVPSLRRFAPAGGCRGVSRRSADRAHDPFGSRWRRRGRFRLPPVRAHVSLAARPRPTVSVGGSTELIGFFAKGSADREFAVGLLGFAPVCGPCPPPFVFCGGPILPWFWSPLSGCCATTDVLALATRALSPSVACRATRTPVRLAHRASPSPWTGSTFARHVRRSIRSHGPSSVSDGTRQDQR